MRLFSNKIKAHILYNAIYLRQSVLLLPLHQIKAYSYTMDFRTRVKEICKEQNMMQKDLAERLGITAIGLSQTLGQDYPQLQTLERIASALGVKVIDLFEQEASSDGTFRCPNCGAVLEVKTKA